jgi:two-component system sensor histidine kinase UhpB
VKLIGICQDITQRKWAEQQIRAANAALSDELKERARAEEEISALSARLITAQEEERTRLARELHDDVGQQVAVASIAMSNLKKEIPCEYQGLRDHSARIQAKLVHVAESIRRLSHDLHPAILQHSGLSAALRAYCSEFGSLTGIAVSFKTDGLFHAVAPEVALCLYRVAQEALQNVLKHAKVNEASVTLRYSAGILSLAVFDAGVGIDLNQTRGGLGLGLISIRERARLLNGTIDIASQPHQGMTLTVKVPL